jgi:hypothetical protein
MVRYLDLHMGGLKPLMRGLKAIELLETMAES